MDKYVIEDTTLTGIADAIREKTETTEDIPVTEMRPKILGITSGGMTASIFVTGLSESDTVTASYGDKTKVAVWNSTKNRHEITGIGDKGTWTVTATNGEDTTTRDVLIDTAAEFEILMTYKPNYLMLYDFGDECEEVTGGWTIDGYSGGFRGTVEWALTAGTKNEDHIYTAVSSGGNTNNALGTNNAIDTTGYSGIFGFAKSVTSDGAQPILKCFLNSKGGAANYNDGRATMLGGTGTQWAYTNDLSILSSYAFNTWNNESNFSGKDIYVLVLSSYKNTRSGEWYAVFMTKEDNLQELCNNADISVPLNVVEFTQDSSAMTAILQNESAVKYMTYHCSGDFMAHAVQSTVFLAALNDSPYKNIVFTSKHWTKFLNMVGVTA